MLHYECVRIIWLKKFYVMLRKGSYLCKLEDDLTDHFTFFPQLTIVRKSL
jgi:hypothetical protein